MFILFISVYFRFSNPGLIDEAIELDKQLSHIYLIYVTVVIRNVNYYFPTSKTWLLFVDWGHSLHDLYPQIM
jgi:hypothetical protein